MNVITVAACFEALFSAIFNPETFDPAPAESVMAEQVSCNSTGNDSWTIIVLTNQHDVVGLC